VPWRFIGQKVDARATITVVQIFCAGALIATHATKTAGKQTDMAHYPPRRSRSRCAPDLCRTRAGEVGPHAVAVIAELLAVNALFRLRAAQGVLHLADKHGPARLEAACGKAITVGDPSYRTIKGILAAGVEAEPPPALTAGPRRSCTALSDCSPMSLPCPAWTARPAWTSPPRTTCVIPTPRTNRAARR
jgi:hypothetical protein